MSYDLSQLYLKGIIKIVLQLIIFNNRYVNNDAYTITIAAHYSLPTAYMNYVL